MIIKKFPSGPFQTNAYAVACPETKTAAILDPAPDSADAIINFLAEQNLTPVSIVITHSHWDHIMDTDKLKEFYKIPVLIHPLDAPNLEKPGSDGLPLWKPFKGVKPDKFLNEGDQIEIGTLKFHVIHTPGHTPGGVCLYCKEEKILLAGDTLFKGSIGNLSQPTSNSDLMWISLSKLSKLPPETTVYPGHGPTTTIGREPWLSRAQDYFGN